MSDKKVALITGGTRGIGKAIAKIFSQKGYNLVLNYVSENTDINKLEPPIISCISESLFEKWPNSCAKTPIISSSDNLNSPEVTHSVLLPIA